MGYRYTDKNRREYVRDGITVLHDVIPPALLRDLRAQATRARRVARKIHGPQAKRLQPIYEHEEIDRRPFDDFRALPELQKTVRAILGADHDRGSVMGILIEPAVENSCLPWHRDWRDGFESVDEDEWSIACRDTTMFNQFNAALYVDSCLWIVPGSHNRADRRREQKYRGMAATGIPTCGDAEDDEQEVLATRYCRSMDGARQVLLLAGDVAFYRSCSWHTGNNLTYAPRATLFDGFYGARDVAWRERAIPQQAESR